MDQNQLFKSFIIFKIQLGHQATDQAAQAFNALDLPKLNLHSTGWIQRSREAQHLTMESLAHKAGISSAAWAQLEQRELSEKISLESLKKAAAALDCELVYGFRTKSRKSFSLQIWRQVAKEALEIYRRRTRETAIKPIVLATIATKLTKNPQFRKERGWSRNQPR